MSSTIRPLAQPTLWFILAAAATVLWVSWNAFDQPMGAFRFESDYWKHSAALAEWKRNLWNPSNPHIAADVGSPRYMPYFFLLTIAAIAFDLDPMTTMAVASAINMILLSLGVFLFFRNYFRNDWAPLVGWFTLLCGWGLGWIFSNLFQLRGLFFVAGYPSLFVFALAFIAWWHTTRLIRGQVQGWSAYIGLVLLIALALTSHPLTGVFAAGTAALIALLEPGAGWRTRALVMGSIVLGALLTEVWPYFSTWQVTMGTSGGSDASWVTSGTFTHLRPDALNHNFYGLVHYPVHRRHAASGIR